MPSASRNDPGAARRHAGLMVWGYLVALVVLHQDFWLRDDPTIVLGFLPAGLAYHMQYTLLAALGWYLVTRFAWPAGFDER